MASFLQLSNFRPNKHAQRALWNKSWENDLKIYETFSKNPPTLTFIQDPANLGPRVPSYETLFVQRYRGEIVELQADARRKSITRLATDGYAEKWTALSAEKRKAHVLEALYKASCSTPDAERCRQWCPELTLEGLADDPQSYLDLLMVLVDSEAELTVFPHPTVDAICEQLTQMYNDNFVSQKFKLDRVFFVTMVIWRIYLAFHELDEIYRFDTTGNKEASGLYREARSAVFPTAGQRNAYRASLREFKTQDNANGETKRCWLCGKSAALLPPNTVLLACSGCKKVDRVVLYCSRECQKNDWKTGLGSGQPHKAICGKPFKVASNSTTREEPEGTRTAEQLLSNLSIEGGLRAQDSQGRRIAPPVIVPKADPGFKRSPALRHQIRLLQQGPSHPDYILVMRHPYPDMGIQIPDLNVRVRFIAARTEALKNGNPAAVNFMYLLLNKFSGGAAPSSYNVKKQLQAEYGVGVGDDSKSKWQPSEEDIEMAIKLLLYLNESNSA